MIKDHVTSKLVYIPHVIDYDTMITKKDSIVKNRIELRNDMNIPTDAVVISIIGGNYELSLRKGFDTSFQVFRNILKYNNKAFLYVQAHKYTLHNGDNDLESIMDQFDVPKDKYSINQTLVDSQKIEEIYKITDILLMGSKTEGFGVPLIEAQIRGIPVVTNKFAAMKDHTYYGVTCDSDQFQYDMIGGGTVSMPSVKNLTEGLLNVINIIQNKNKNKNKNNIIEKIKVEMSYEKIKGQIIETFETTNMKYKIDDTNKDDKDDYDFCIIIIGNNNNNNKDDKNNLYKFDKYKFKIINVEHERLIYPAIRNLRYKFLACLDDRCTIIPVFIPMMVKEYESKNLVCVISTQYKDGSIYPTTNNDLFKDGRINMLISQNVVKIDGFSDVFFNEIIKRGTCLKCLTVTSSIVANEK